MFAPCKNCEKKFIGCHSTCEDYKEFCRQNAALKKKIREAKDQYYGSLTTGKRKRYRNKNGYYV